jgi:hypothetical protein
MAATTLPMYPAPPVTSTLIDASCTQSNNFTQI